MVKIRSVGFDFCEDKYFREKMVFEICGSFVEKEDFAHVSRLFWPI